VVFSFSGDAVASVAFCLFPILELSSSRSGVLSPSFCIFLFCVTDGPYRIPPWCVDASASFQRAKEIPLLFPAGHSLVWCLLAPNSPTDACRPRRYRFELLPQVRPDRRWDVHLPPQNDYAASLTFWLPPQIQPDFQSMSLVFLSLSDLVGRDSFSPARGSLCFSASIR